MYVYAVQARGYVKIGKANNPEARLTELQVGNPVKLVMRLRIPCKSEAAAEHLESTLQRMFGRFRVRGEWFEYSPIARLIDALPTCASTHEMCQMIRAHFRVQRAKRQERHARATTESHAELDREFRDIIG